MDRSLLTTAALLSLALGACDDPTLLREPPSEDRITMLGVLDPAFDTQAVWITPFDRDSIRGLTVEVWSGGVRVATGVTDPRTWGEHGVSLCRLRYNSTLWGPSRWQTPRYCMDLPLRPAGGVTYEVRVEAESRPSARGSTTIPGGFAIHSISARGDPPGTEGLDAAWSRSEGAYRYAVMVRSLNGSEFFRDWEYPYHGWYRATGDTAVSLRAPADSIDPQYGAPYVLEIFALDRALYEHITSGSQDDLFPVPPASNVTGGFGVVGSWVRRTAPVDSP